MPEYDHFPGLAFRANGGGTSDAERAEESDRWLGQPDSRVHAE